jgi:hypothetical protein
MSILARRVQVLLSDAQFAELEAQAHLRKKSIGAVIREALAEHLSVGDRAERIEAVRTLAAMRLPVSDWEQMERESAGDLDGG